MDSEHSGGNSVNEDVLRKKPAQSRSSDRVKDILSAARTHYTEVGRDRFNTTAVAQLAGCSVGTLYRYFVDRVALMDAFVPHRDSHEHKLREIHAAVEKHDHPISEHVLKIIAS